MAKFMMKCAKVTRHIKRMEQPKITPVMLVGGSGTRLWPVSRKSYPKQFANLVEGGSLFQQSAQRLACDMFTAPLVLSNADFRFIITKQLDDIDITPHAVLIEPSMRNTAPAILAASMFLAETDPDSLILVTPSDHIIPDAAGFADTVSCGIEAATQGAIVTFGITPDRPETGYGYLELAAHPQAGHATALRRFVEKPQLADAEAMLASGNYLWNAGIFLFTAGTMIKAFEQHAPEMLEHVRKSLAAAEVDLGFLRLDPEAWNALEDVSIDYAIMEKAEKLMVVPYSGHWSDLGGWEAVWRELQTPLTENGVVTDGHATAIDCQDVLLKSESDEIEIVGIGLKNLIAVATSDAVLIADTSRAQDVRKAVGILKAKGRKQAEQAPRDHRPWGFFETLALGERFQVKRITVHPGAALSLQSHFHRAEHWIVVSGTARVTVNQTETLMTENQSIYIPLGAVHRLENPGKVPMVLIEVQTGTYLGEDDIIRHEDVYARP